MSLEAATRLVTLLSDFGLQDPFVGIMKGVMLREAPGLELIDLTHGIPAQDVRAAAFTLLHSFHWFGEGAVHLCVVDPGVGSERAPVALRAKGHTFVGPDNGLFSPLLELEPSSIARRIEPSVLGLTVSSRTFHGRDVFAPVAARLAAGLCRFEDVGPIHALTRGTSKKPARGANGATGSVVLIDHFGNLITDLPADWLAAGDFQVEIGKYSVRRVGTYSEARPGECVALVSSFETLEIAQRDGNAAQTLGIGRGETVRITRQESP